MGRYPKADDPESVIAALGVHYEEFGATLPPSSEEIGQVVAQLRKYERILRSMGYGSADEYEGNEPGPGKKEYTA
eukprot:24561-Eustigmatos_ZCMA.PRE.1